MVKLILSNGLTGLNQSTSSHPPHHSRMSQTLVSANQGVRFRMLLTQLRNKQKKLLLKVVLFFRGISLPKPIQEYTILPDEKQEKKERKNKMAPDETSKSTQHQYYSFILWVKKRVGKT